MMTRYAYVWLLCAYTLGCGGSDGGPGYTAPDDAATARADAAPPASEPDAGAPRPDPVPDAAPDPVRDAAPDPEPPVRSVLLIPGTTIKGEFFDSMAAKLKRDGFEPVIFEPPDLFTESLALGGERIAERVQSRLKETGERRVHIVAECDGGVATRYYLQLLGGAAWVDQVVTFVSAHHGTWLSPVGSWVTGFQALEDIVPGSPFMRKLNSAPFPPGLSLTSIYSCNDELMLPYDTSVVAGATNVLFCDHYLGHFDGFWDPVVYGHILATLRGKGSSLPVRY